MPTNKNERKKEARREIVMNNFQLGKNKQHSMNTHKAHEMRCYIAPLFDGNLVAFGCSTPLSLMPQWMCDIPPIVFNKMQFSSREKEWNDIKESESQLFTVDNLLSVSHRMHACNGCEKEGRHCGRTSCSCHHFFLYLLFGIGTRTQLWVIWFTTTPAETNLDYNDLSPSIHTVTYCGFSW